MRAFVFGGVGLTLAFFVACSNSDDATKSGSQADGGASSTAEAGGVDRPDPHLSSDTALLDEVGKTKDPNAIVAFAKTLPDVGDAFAASDANSVTVVYTDRTPVLVNLVADPRGSTAFADSHAHVLTDVHVPDGDTFVLFNMLSAKFGDPITPLQQIATQAHYAMSFSKGTLADLADSSRYAQAGLVYLGTHGNVGEIIKGSPELVLGSSDCRSRDGFFPRGFTNDITKGPNGEDVLPEIAKVIDPNDGPVPAGCATSESQPGKTLYWGITRTFVTNHMKLHPNTIFVADACQSDKAGSEAFKAALRDQGAARYVGWSETTNDPGRAVPFLVDRMAGSNTYDGDGGYAKENPPQRPFTADSVLKDMQARGLDTAPNGAKLQLENLTAEDVNHVVSLLAPVISQVRAVETPETVLNKPVTQASIVLAGTLPSDANPEFHWGADTLHIAQVDPTPGAGQHIYIVDFPDSPKGGDVYAIVNNHESNHVRVSEHRGVVSLSVGPSRYQDKLTVTFHGLGFPMLPTRTKPHETPLDGGWIATWLPDSTIELTPGPEDMCTRTLNVDATRPFTDFESAVFSIGYLTPNSDIPNKPSQIGFSIAQNDVITETCQSGPNPQSVIADTSLDSVQVGITVDPATFNVQVPLSSGTNEDGDDTLTVNPTTIQAVVGPLPATSAR